MRRFLALICFALASSCTMGPDYAGPPDIAAGASGMRFPATDNAINEAEPALASWWTSLKDETLNTLISRALAANSGMATIRLRVRQARATLSLERSSNLPAIGTRVAAVHAELPDLVLPVGSPDRGSSPPDNDTQARLGSLDLFSASFDARWEVDLFGGRRRAVEAALATVGAAEADLEDARVQLTAEVAQTYNNLRVQQKLLTLVHETAALDRRILELLKQREERGVASSLDVERFQSRLDSTSAQITSLEAELAIIKNALALLAGEEPRTFDGLIDGPAPLLSVPARINVGDPSSLLRRRPDIRAAERQLAAQTAGIGIAEASRFPRLSLFGLIGLGSNSVSSFSDGLDLSALAMPQLQWQFLDFGRGAARVERARGSRDEAEIRYRQSVLEALRDADDALTRFGHRRQSLFNVAQARASAARSSALVLRRFRGGTATLIDVLEAERQRIASERDLVRESGALFGDYVSLQKALGLGWSSG